ncbi:MAG: peptidase M48 [Isosphaera sp.]|nr:peptidase M48 [Isosphaera sp.]
MTNFFQHQARARRNTARLVLLFAAAVAAVVGLTYLVALGLDAGLSKDRRGPVEWWRPELLAAAVGGTLLVVGGGSAYKVSQLAGGGKAVALMVGGREVPTNSRDPRERRLLNVVEEMAIASGVPVPPVFVLEEPSINAFAAGYAPDDAVVAVSQGALDYLTRDELQGVVAHEFSHILNGDMRLNIRLVGWIHGLVVLSLVGRFLIEIIGQSNRNSSRRSKKNEGGLLLALFLLGVALYVLGAVGAFFGWLIQAAASRQREYLADASAVQFTRNPDGIGGALKKIGGLDAGARVENPNAAEVSHMFFADALTGRLTGLFDSHPPLELRIRAIDPAWDGTYPKVRRVAVEPEPDRPAGPTAPRLPLPVPMPHLAADAAVARIGTVPDESLATAARFEDAVTPDLRELIGEPYSARAVVLGLLLDADEGVRVAQLAGLEASVDPPDLVEVRRLADRVRAVPPGTRLAVVHFAMPALRRMSPEQYRRFRAATEVLALMDRRLSLFEFCLQHLLTRSLDRAFGLRPPARVRARSAAALADRAATLLGMLAREGHPDAGTAGKAFVAGMREWDPAWSGSLPDAERCSPPGFAAALDAFEEAASGLKERLVRAAAVCVVADRALTATEYELLRTLCSALGCPFPPLGPRG